MRKIFAAALSSDVFKCFTEVAWILFESLLLEQIPSHLPKWAKQALIDGMFYPLN